MALSLKYLESRKGIKCLICANEGDRHHLKAVGAGRDRTKPHWEHFTIINLCREHHTELHQTGEKKFSEKHYINLWKYALLSLAKWLFKKEEAV